LNLKQLSISNKKRESISYFDRMEILDGRKQKQNYHGWMRIAAMVWIVVLAVFSAVWIFQLINLYFFTDEQLLPDDPDTQLIKSKIQLGTAFHGVLIVLQLAAFVGLRGKSRAGWTIAFGVFLTTMAFAGLWLLERYIIIVTSLHKDWLPSSSYLVMELWQYPETYILCGSLFSAAIMLTRTTRYVFKPKWHSFLVSLFLSAFLIIVATIIF
jgi:hypothetical protein